MYCTVCTVCMLQEEIEFILGHWLKERGRGRALGEWKELDEELGKVKKDGAYRKHHHQRHTADFIHP